MISKNHVLIFASQLVDRLRAIKTRRVQRQSQSEVIHGIRNHCTGEPRKRALVSLSPVAWRAAVDEYPEIRFFNIGGLTYEVIKALNECGYEVDLCDCNATDFVPNKSYDLFFAHNVNTRSIIEKLPPDCPVLHYVSGPYWKAFNEMSQRRYDDFCRRRELPLKTGFVRSFGGREDGEEFLIRRADAAFTSGPRNIATYGGASRNMALLFLGSYVEKDLVVENRDFEAGRKNFIYVAGSGGNVQKGMDLLIEAFSKMPDLHLYIYCKVESDISQAYPSELSLPNIHYVYHYSRSFLRRRMRELLKRINFTISAPIDIGPGTAFLGSMGLGLIPVGYVDILAEESNSVLTGTASVESLMSVARDASEKSADWCRQASSETLERFATLHDPPAFGRNFKRYFERLGL